MKRLICLALAFLFLLSGCGAASDTTDAAPAPEQQETGQEQPPEEGREEVTIFPKTDAFIGDTMPYYEDGTMNVFYLADQRDGKTGYHPWGLIRTKDYCSYEDMGIVIPYGETIHDQDIALGTGCVIKDQNGGYHAFYTGHNDHFSPKEAIMHATSSDMLNWTKVPEDTFIATDAYSLEDFRDPYVFYVAEEQCYWMLVVTRSEGTGVIVKYTSKDLSKWEDGGIFFTDDMGYGTNMECPTLLQFGGKWYLTFSDQWPDRVVHYRVSDSIHGPFTKPEQDTVDGSGFYAGRLETDGEHLYVVGWNGTKVDHLDENDYDWAGNMVIHQLSQQPDGTLKPIPNEKVVEIVSHPLTLEPVVMTDTVQADGSTFTMAGDQYELVQFEALDGSTRLEADISGWKEDGLFGFSFAPDMENVGPMNYVFNIKENRIEFYNTDNIVESDAQSFMDYDFTGKDSVHVTMFIGDGVATIYVDNEVALTARMYRSQGTNWQLFGVNSGVTWSNVSIYG